MHRKTGNKEGGLGGHGSRGREGRGNTEKGRERSRGGEDVGSGEEKGRGWSERNGRGRQEKGLKEIAL